MVVLKMAALAFLPALLMADIADTINAVIATCAGKQSCYVALQPGAEYTFANTITIPDQYVDLDCRGAKLNYTGTGRAISVLSSPSGALGNANLTGRIHDCYILGNAGTDRTAIWQESRFGMVYENLRIRNFSGNNGIGIKFENKSEPAGFPGTNQFNTVRQCDFVNNRFGISIHRTTGGDEFNSNTFKDLHFNLTDGQTGIITIGLNTSGSLQIIGGYYSASFTISFVASNTTAINLTQGTDWERSTVQITGSQDAGPTASWSLIVSANSVFDNYGVYEIAGTAFSLLGPALLHPHGFRNGLAPPLIYTIDNTGLTRFQRDITIGTGSGGTHINGDRTNWDTSFQVVIPSGGTNSNTYNFAHAFNSTPSCTMSVNTFLHKRVYINAGITNVVFSFSADVSNVLTPFNFNLSPVMCSGPFAGPGGTPCGYMDVPAYPAAVVDGTSFKASLDYPADTTATVFVHCFGNQN